MREAHMTEVQDTPNVTRTVVEEDETAIMIDGIVHTKRHGTLPASAGTWMETPRGYFLSEHDLTIPYGEVTLIQWSFPEEGGVQQGEAIPFAAGERP